MILYLKNIGTRLYPLEKAPNNDATILELLLGVEQTGWYFIASHYGYAGETEAGWGIPLVADVGGGVEKNFVPMGTSHHPAFWDTEGAGLRSDTDSCCSFCSS